MKFVKGISLFFIYPVFLLTLGFYAGVKTTHYFYPGEQTERLYYRPEEEKGVQADSGGEKEEPAARQSGSLREDALPEIADSSSLEAQQEETLSLEASATKERLSVETKYVLEERDIEGDTTVETTWKLPDRYVGMNREQFIEAMELYEASPPLSELERGFVSLEVLSFSREKVVVQMNYRYVLPSGSFYLAVYDNEVVVYLEDRETVYIETDIQMEQLPESIQRDIINMLWIEDEETLYDFLEAYSS
ncbi:MAG: hypothetical protein NC541_00505 [bacterium]|nr:hypothetical protein [bacterium]